MAFDRAKTSLAQIEDKLRKVFGLAGTIGAQLDPTLTPSYTIGDARDPGTSGFKGRHWAWSHSPTGFNGLGTVGITAPVPLLVRGFTLTGCQPALVMEVHVVAPDHAMLAVWVANRPAGTWIDQKATEADATPILDRQLVVAGGVYANPQLTEVARWSVPNVANPSGETFLRTFDRGIHIPANGALLFRCTTFVGLPVASAWGEIA